ncbi:MAG: hypothetical protein Q7S75_03525 [bacterium]|nr:hypothetical protein [bacterium]
MTGFSILVPALSLVLPAIAFAATAPRTWSELVNALVSIMSTGAITLITLAFVIYFYGISSNILKFGEDTNGEKKRAYFVWGIIILFVMVSIWGILRLLQNTFLGNA